MPWSPERSPWGPRASPGEFPQTDRYSVIIIRYSLVGPRPPFMPPDILLEYLNFPKYYYSLLLLLFIALFLFWPDSFCGDSSALACSLFSYLDALFPAGLLQIAYSITLEYFLSCQTRANKGQITTQSTKNCLNTKSMYGCKVSNIC